jgi:hypothetical protein
MITIRNNGIDSIEMTKMIFEGSELVGKKMCFQASTSPGFAQCGRQSPEIRAKVYSHVLG